IPLRPNDTRDVVINWKMSQTWKGMEALVKKGELDPIQSATRKLTKSYTGKLELHLYNRQLNLLAHLKPGAIVAQAYSPLGLTNSPLLTDDTASTIAKKYRLQISDVLLGYLLAQDAVVLPKWVTPARMVSNYVGTVAAVKRLAEEGPQTLDGVAVGGKQKRLAMSDCGE
ncbi:hypothetical protein FIBSPDRAFT_756886, partial [Athelia psychrophila]